METPTNLIPDDVRTVILLRLPVKSLLRFRCVSKSWNSLISSQQFSETHLRFSKRYSDFTHDRAMFRDSNGSFKHCSLTYLLNNEPVTLIDAYYTLPFSWKLIWVGSCNGLVCLRVDAKALILWNPSTRKSKNLPDTGFELNYGFARTFGFGFDTSCNDYKVVAFYSGRFDVLLKIFSLKTGEWKRIKNHKVRWLTDYPAAFANGKLHWLVHSNRMDHTYIDPETGESVRHHGGVDRETGEYICTRAWDIAYLDLATEEYGLLHAPNNMQGCPFFSMLASSEGCLYVFCVYLTLVDLWVIAGDESGKEKLTKVASIPCSNYSFKRLLYVLKSGDIYFTCGSKLVIFNKEDGLFKYPEIRSSHRFVMTGTYVESLVSPVE